MEFTNGEFLHLALVDNPRYERANIVMNSKDEERTVKENLTTQNSLTSIFTEAIAEVVTNCLGESRANNWTKDNFKESKVKRDGGKFAKQEKSRFFEKWNNAPNIDLKPPLEWTKIKNIKELRSNVKSYLQNTIRKISLERKELGKIRFSNKSIDEYISYSADKDKLLAAYQIPQFIGEGKLGEYFDSTKDRNKQDSIKGFYPIFFNLKTSAGFKNAEILIGKDDNGKLFFDMFLDYDREKAQSKKGL